VSIRELRLVVCRSGLLLILLFCNISDGLDLVCSLELAVYDVDVPGVRIPEQ